MEELNKPSGQPPSANSAIEEGAALLRARAEGRVRRKFPLPHVILETMSPEAAQQMFHELQVHQIELEMQNEELQSSQVRLYEAKSRYFDLYDMAPVGYCTVSEQGVITEANIAAATLLGMTRNLLVGQRISRYIVKSSQDRFYLHCKQVFATGNAQACELQMVRTDGSFWWVNLTATTALERDGSRVQRVVLHDITDTKVLYNALEESEGKFRSLLESSPDATVIVDQQGTMVLVNARTQAIFGYSRAELIGKKVELLMPTRLHQQHEDHRSGFMTQARTREMSGDLQLLGMRKDKSEFLIEVSLSPLHTKRGLLVSCAIRDVTERRHLADLLIEKNVELESARYTADKANRAKSDFLSSMSHELRTPLSAILGFAQLIDAGTPAPTPSQKRSVDQILQAGWYLLDLINEILDLALVESGKLSLELQVIALADVMRECQTMVEPQANERGISVSFPEFLTPYFVKADGTRVKQILINLLSNAIKYNKVGGSVVVTCLEVDPGRIHICVEDTGQGLSPDKLGHLFQPFNRLGQEAQTEQGTGIGLVMTKRLVELMGGAIGVKSVVGKGSTFWIEMDLTTEKHPAEDPSPTQVKAQLAAPATVGAPLQTLLYIEDNPANLLLIESLMEHRPDIQLLSAKNGISGLELALTALPDVILMDINLPGISGAEVLKLLQANPATANIPVMALSANAMPADIEKGLAAGFYRYLTKPIKINAFMATLDDALALATTRPGRVSNANTQASQASQTNQRNIP
ncbi:MAG: PAS domain S-box protein [Polaromonas sp.]|nr:PAS domain S-box protein [Polaromonas sp.]